MKLPKELLPENLALGATGAFPGGKKLNESDEGELRFAVGHDEDGLVHVNFGKPVTWFALPSELAIQLARLLLAHAGAKKVEITL